ncbi:hypothetical protein K435DRAFT_117126 [Dendrothele bispora CBS 962.96]|uniref:PH domain-containing protein n=1 Tax=Dendrothele bispora (strain CBS 962.96) TaxID=1314807 RepID=A0A4S8MQN7_DENBC|nr:hypothetical protein K435DRAFT_117126 [Dendrothele bispora CBS 962.96]
MPFSNSRPTSPNKNHLPFHRKTDSSFAVSSSQTRSAQLSNGIMRSASKGKERAHDDDLSILQNSTHNTTSRPLSMTGISVSSAPVSSSPSKRSSTRGSILVQATDVLGNIKFGRRRKSIRSPVSPPRMPIILPEVIEISAPPPDVEVEERDRLREEAAQALGLGAPTTVEGLASNAHHDGLLHDRGEDENEREEADFQQEEAEVSIDRETLAESISRTSESAPAPNNQFHHIPHPFTSTASVSIPPSPKSPTHTVVIHGRHRSGSMPAAPHIHHNRSSSIISTPVPPFPSTHSSLMQFIQQSSTFPKYYPSSSLRIFALTRQWKNRFLVLSTPTALPTLSRNHSPSVSYLHLFKSSAAEEKEIERLEINEDSVVFVADEEVGGRRHVIKVGGKDVGALKKEFNIEEGGRTMWLLQITDPSESQKWITSIKTAIFGQRTMRAGLGHSSPLASGVVEPRGDMDVMLSMRTQGMISSPTRTKFEIPDQPNGTTTSISSPQRSPTQDATHSYAPSVASVRSQSAVPKSSNGNAVSALKGLFSGNNSVGRPRSSSRATSIVESENGEESGNTLMSILRSPTTDSLADSPGGSRVNAQSGTHPTHLARALSVGSVSPPPSSIMNRLPSQRGSILSTISGLPHSSDSGMGVHTPAVDLRIDRKILTNPISVEGDQFVVPQAKEPSTSNVDRATRTMSVGSISLLPPPRKRWTSMGSPSIASTDSPAATSPQLPPDTHSEMGVMGFHVQNASSASIVEADEPSSPPQSTSFFGTPPHRPRSPSSKSIRSVSTLASSHSVTNSVHASAGSPGVSSIGTKRNSGKRWSRQLPQRLTPPSIPPPAIPGSQTPNGNVNASSSVQTLRHPYLTEGRSSSQSSVISNLPSKFSKRASASSAFSVKTTSTTQSKSSGHVNVNAGTTNGIVPHSRTGSSNRSSISPPPRPAPTFALPPAPVSAPVNPPKESPSNSTSPTPHSAPTSKRSSLRESVTNRALRLSLSAPKPPPSSVLPPRPDEDTSPHTRNRSQGHSRNPSGSSQNQNGSILYSIPGSPSPPSPPLTNPFPPPRGPLPPPPPVPDDSIEPLPVLPPPSRHSSIKQRLRILSAPSTISSSSSHVSRPSTSTIMSSNTSPPSTPGIGTENRLGYIQIPPHQGNNSSGNGNNDSSFLSLLTPATPLPTPKIHTLTEPDPEAVVPLSPPPRPKRTSIPEYQMEFNNSNRDEPAPPLPDPMPDPLPSAVAPESSDNNSNKLLSLSRHGSVISLGIVSM